MSIRKTVDVIEMLARDRYGKETGDIAEAHVATTIVHDVVHLTLTMRDANGHVDYGDEMEVNMTNDEARTLIAALAAAIADNKSHSEP